MALPFTGTVGTSKTKSDEEYTDPVAVCNIHDVLENEMREYDFIENTKVLVVKQNNQIKALGSKCTHYGAPLHTGALGMGRIRCPWHGACFDINTGDIEDFPGLDSLPCYQVEVKNNGKVMIRAKRKDLQNSRRVKDMVKRDLKNPLCYVIIGGGPAGGVCVETLRQQGFTGRVVMVCKEKYLPYDRVAISKGTNIKLEKIQFRKPEFYEEYDIETLMSTEAIKVDCSIKTIYLSNDSLIQYDKMFIATGCSVSTPEIKGFGFKGVLVLRGFEDIEKMDRMIQPKKNVICLGSSFVALEVAQTWLQKCKSMTLISRSPLALMGSFGPMIGKRVLQIFQDNNVNLIMNSGIAEIVGDINKRITDVILTDGSKLPCDILILGTGTKYNTKFLIGSGLPVNPNGSIDADVYLKSLIDDVYVGGDIANAPVWAYNNQRATVGHYQLAQYHGRIAAINMIGNSPQELRAVPFFFTEAFGYRFRYAGYGPYIDTVIDGDLDNLKFAIYFISEQDYIVAVASCGKDPIVSQFAELLSQGKKLHRSDLQQPDRSGWTKMLKQPISTSLSI